MKILLMFLFAYNTVAVITEGTWVVIIGQSVIVLTLIINKWFDLKNREEDRKDREALAVLTQKGLDDVKHKGAEREMRIVEKIDAAHETTTKALEVANSHNDKIATAVELSLEAIRAAKEIPQKMEVVGTVETHVVTDPIESKTT